MRAILGCAVLAVLAAGAAPATAHHSFAMFDNAKTLTLQGAITELEWTNPHAWVHLKVKDAAGKDQDWAFEMQGPGQLAARGWSRDSVRAGDKVTIWMHPLRDGSNGGSYVSIKLANGTFLGPKMDG